MSIKYLSRQRQCRLLSACSTNEELYTLAWKWSVENEFDLTGFYSAFGINNNNNNDQYGADAEQTIVVTHETPNDDGIFDTFVLFPLFEKFALCT